MNTNISMNQRQARASDKSPAPPADTSFAVLPIDAIEPYRYNPRIGRNPRYHEIKASIRADGITNMLTVTRRDRQSKYTTYGGGNTRLMIAKELAAEGDARFATLQVMVKAWPGDTQVITAQLAENENRSDITFWEKARVVQQFRALCEKEIGRTLSTAALHEELKLRGLHYGLRTLQNFAFSVAHLAPIGRWLAARSVNEVIRPAYVGLRRLAKKLGKDEQMYVALDDELQLCEIRLECAEQPAELDVQRLLNDWQRAAARLLGASVEQLQAMLAALMADADISAQELLALSAALPQQKAIAAPGDDAAQEAQPKPLDAPTPTLPLPQTEKLRAEIKDLLGRISQIVPLHDVIRACDMPFGFIVDFPAEGDGWSKAGGKSVPQPYLRQAMWLFLVSISGQLDRRVPLPSEGVTFSSGLAKDKEAFCAEFEKRGMPMNGAMPLMEGGEIAAIFAEPRLGSFVIKLLGAIDKLRAADPERAPDFFERRFA